MDLLTMSENLDKLSKQLVIIQDYITLKFGVDFQEFFKSHSESQEEDTVDKFENATDLNLVVASNSGNNYLSINNANATRLSTRNTRRTPVNARDQDHTHTSVSNTSIPEVHLEPIDVKTEDDFFNEMGGSSDDNMDDNDPLDQEFNAGGIETFLEDSASGADAIAGSSAYVSCDRKRKRAKKKIPTAPRLDFKVQLIRALKDIKKIQVQHGDLLNVMISRSTTAKSTRRDSTTTKGIDNGKESGSDESNDSDLEEALEMFQFPLSDPVDMDRLETHLGSSREAKKCLTLKLSKCGTGDMKESMTQMLKSVLTDELTAAFSLKGMRGKASFEAYSFLTRCISEALKKNPRLPSDLSDLMIAKGIGDGLKRAADRVSARIKKDIQQITLE